MGQGDFHDLGPELFELLHRRVHGVADLGIHAADEIFLGQTEPKSFDVAIEGRDIIGHWLRDAGGIL